MSLTVDAKDELARVRVEKMSARRAEVAATLRFAGGLHIISGHVVIEAELDTAIAARRLRQEILEVFGHRSELIVVSGGGCGAATATSSGWCRTARDSPARPD